MLINQLNAVEWFAPGWWSVSLGGVLDQLPPRSPLDQFGALLEATGCQDDLILASTCVKVSGAGAMWGCASPRASLVGFHRPSLSFYLHVGWPARCLPIYLPHAVLGCWMLWGLHLSQRYNFSDKLAHTLTLQTNPALKHPHIHSHTFKYSYFPTETVYFVAGGNSDLIKSVMQLGYLQKCSKFTHKALFFWMNEISFTKQNRFKNVIFLNQLYNYDLKNVAYFCNVLTRQYACRHYYYYSVRCFIQSQI